MDLKVCLTEIFFRKRTKSEKRLVKKAKRIRHRGTDWKNIKPKKGYKRVRVGRHYVRVKLHPSERMTKKRVGRALGKNARRLKK